MLSTSSFATLSMLDKEEGTTVAALLAMPQTPLAAPWESVDEDVFTWLLNGMDTPAADQASSSMPPVQRPFTPLDLAGGNGGLGTPSAAQTNFTWADALNQSLGDALTDHASAAAAAAAAEEYSLLHFLEPLSPAPDRTPASNRLLRPSNERRQAVTIGSVGQCGPGDTSRPERAG